MESGKAVDGLVTCEFCGMKRTVPKRETKPAALTYLMLAEHDLEVCEFDKAYTGYQKAAEADGTESEAYFGMALARFKVQYLKDFTGEQVRLQPVCHEITDKMFTEDKNYRKALSLSTETQRGQYEKQAKEIDYINREFAALKAQGAKYDCFLCVKVTNESGGHTEDSHTATTLYHELKKAGYSPFYSEEEVRGRTGADYEALILYALWSSRCMLVICSNEEYLQTPWVKNEYTRFIKMLREEEKEDRSIAIVFGDTPVEKLAGVQGKIQGIPFKSYDALDRIRAFVDRFVVKEAPELARKDYGNVAYQKKRALKTGVEKRRLTVTGGGEVTVSDKAKLNLASEMLSRGDFTAAIRFCDQLIKDNPQNGEAYRMRFLAENQCFDTEEFVSKQVVSENFADLEKAIAATKNQTQRKKLYTLLSERVNRHHDFSCYEEYIELPESEEKTIAELTKIIYSDALEEKDCEKFAAVLKTVSDSDRYIEMNLTFAHALREENALEYYRNILSVDEGHEESLWFVFERETAKEGTVRFCLNTGNFPVLEEKLFSYGFNGYAAEKLFRICMNSAENDTEQSAALFDFLLGMIPKEKNGLFAEYDEAYLKKLFEVKKPNLANKYNELLLQIDKYNHGAYFNRCLIKRGLSNPLGLLAEGDRLLEDENYFAAMNCFAEKFPEEKNLYLNIKYAFDEMKGLLNYPECFEYAVNNCYVVKEEIPTCYGFVQSCLKGEGKRIYEAALKKYDCNVMEGLFRLRGDVSSDPAWTRALSYAKAAGDTEFEGILSQIISSQSEAAAKNVANDKKKAREEKTDKIEKSVFGVLIALAAVMVGLTIASLAGAAPLRKFGILLFNGDFGALLGVGIPFMCLAFIGGIVASIVGLCKGRKMAYRIVTPLLIAVSFVVSTVGGVKWSDYQSLQEACAGDGYVLELGENEYDGSYWKIVGYSGTPKDLVIPSGIKTINANIFKNCPSITSVTVENDGVVIGNEAFRDCSSIAALTIKGDDIVIGSGAFRDCSSVAALTIEGDGIEIDVSAFTGCSALSTLVIPNGTTVQRDAFSFCGSMTNATIGSDVNLVRGAFWECHSLKSVTIGKGTSIGEYMFGHCTSLTEINYEGTIAQWKNLTKGFHWNDDTGDYTVHCTDGDVSK